MTIDLVRVREAISCAQADRPPTAVEVRVLWRCLYAYVEEVLPLVKMRLLDQEPGEARFEVALAVEQAEDLLTVPVVVAVRSSSYSRQLARVLAGLIQHSGAGGPELPSTGRQFIGRRGVPPIVDSAKRARDSPPAA
ncbi:hypothetical protein AB0I22_19645 [Streptomyces sp. NPDC050610]|uniref:hypothetical protein n=1 Tax=Streptomyces sp. NPDC050610 TaxID=3157097 RepID=UPI003414DC8D